MEGFIGFLGDFFETSLQGLGFLFSVFYDAVYRWFSELKIPIMPTTSALFKNNYLSGGLLIAAVIFILVKNISAFRLFRLDKRLAKKAPPKEENVGRSKQPYERISESRLLWKCFWFGAVGSLLGMVICHHKTRKPKFVIGVTVMLILQLMLYSTVFGFFGFWIYF